MFFNQKNKNIAINYKRRDTVEFTAVKSMWPEKKGFTLYRPKLKDEYIFIHFLTPAIIFIKGEYIKARQGACIFFPPGACQEFSSPECELLHDWFHVTADFEALMIKYNVEPFKLYYPDSTEITEIIKEIEFEHLSRSLFFDESIRILSEKLLIALVRSDKSSGFTPSPAPDLHKQQFIHARSEIHMNYQKDWTISEMADLVHLSPSRFFTLYKGIFGISPKEDLLNSRIQHAEMFLSQGHTVGETAFLSGFTNQYNFIRQFKKFTGKTPGKYKKD